MTTVSPAKRSSFIIKLRSVLNLVIEIIIKTIGNNPHQTRQFTYRLCRKYKNVTL